MSLHGVAAFAAGSLSEASPLLIAALGECVVERAGLVNIGIEGFMLVGALAAAWAAMVSHAALPGIVVGALVGIAFSAGFALLTVTLSADQVVTGVVLNLFAAGLTGVAARRLTGASGRFLSAPEVRLIWGVNPISLAAIALVPIFWWWLFKTTAGLRLRMSGASPHAAAAAGIRIRPVQWCALACGGAMAGLAGAYLSVGDTGTFKENMTAGRGFIALAIVAASRRSPVGCLIISLVFGAASQLQYYGQALGIRLPYQLFLALPYLLTLIILAVSAGGEPFRARQRDK